MNGCRLVAEVAMQWPTALSLQPDLIGPEALAERRRSPGSLCRPGDPVRNPFAQQPIDAFCANKAIHRLSSTRVFWSAVRLLAGALARILLRLFGPYIDRRRIGQFHQINVH